MTNSTAVRGAGLRIAGLAATLLLLTTTSASAATYPAVVGIYGTPGCAASPWFASGMTGDYNCAIANYGNGWDIVPGAATVGGGAAGQWQVNAPAGLTIASAQPDLGASWGWVGGGYGWNAGGFWQGGSNIWPTNGASGSGAINSSYYGFKLYCYASSCPGITNGIYDVRLTVQDISLYVQENQGPALNAVGGNNLWYQGGPWVWNPAGDPFSVELQASDPSGVCNMWARAQTFSQGPSSSPNVYEGFQQCPTPVDWSPGQGAQIDTNQIVPPGSSGSFPLQLGASNAAGVQSTVNETIDVDNVQPSVSFATPNDANPGAWVNHAVSVDSTASAGPSGVGGQSCGTDGAVAQGYSGPLTVDGDGAHTVTCTAWNNAVGPQGQPNTGSSSMTVHIDESPPSLSFAPQNPNAPTQLVVDTSDGESGVAGGSVQIAPAGTRSWSGVPTSFDGQHLMSQINDAGLKGPYTIQATSCDNVGNCASSSETLAMPVRIAASSQVSFARIVAPAKVVHRRVLVGWHWQRIRINGLLERVRVGGHFLTIRIVIGRNALCAERRVWTGRHRWREIRVCRQLTVRLVGHERVAYGRPVSVNGVLVSGQGVPIADAPVRILTAPDNGLGQFSQAAVVRTSGAGGWLVRLPAGPSRLIEAVYDGNGRVLPAVGEVSVSVPARISLHVAPHAVPWGGQITFTGRLDGGYIPPDGVALRLLIRYTGAPQSSVLLAFRTDSLGRFRISFDFPGGRGVVAYPFWVATTATESDYPFAPARSRSVLVTFGGTTPVAGSGGGSGPGSPQGHHRHHRHRRRRGSG